MYLLLTRLCIMYLDVIGVVPDNLVPIECDITVTHFLLTVYMLVDLDVIGVVPDHFSAY